MKIRLLLVIYLTMVVKSCRLCFNNVSLMNYWSGKFESVNIFSTWGGTVERWVSRTHSPGLSQILNLKLHFNKTIRRNLWGICQVTVWVTIWEAARQKCWEKLMQDLTLKNGKSPGPGGICNEFYKQFGNNIFKKTFLKSLQLIFDSAGHRHLRSSHAVASTSSAGI